MVGVSVQSISKYENGHQTPKLNVFHTIASALKMPRPYFLRPLAPEEDRPVFWRGKLSAPPVMRERAGVRLEWLKEVVDYIAGYFDLPNLNVPEFKVDTLEAVGQGELEEIATEIRARWDLRSEEHTSELQSLMRLSYAVFF